MIRSAFPNPSLFEASSSLQPGDPVRRRLPQDQEVGRGPAKGRAQLIRSGDVGILGGPPLCFPDLCPVVVESFESGEEVFSVQARQLLHPAEQLEAHAGLNEMDVDRACGLHASGSRVAA